MARDILIEAMRLKRQRKLSEAQRWERLREYIATTLVRTERELTQFDRDKEGIINAA